MYSITNILKNQDRMRLNNFSKTNSLDISTLYQSSNKHNVLADEPKLIDEINNSRFPISGWGAQSSSNLMCALTRDPDTAMSSSVLIPTLTTSSVWPYNTWTGFGQRPTGAPACTAKQTKWDSSLHTVQPWKMNSLMNSASMNLKHSYSHTV